MTTYYKAVRLDRTSHYDRATRWPDAGGVVTVANFDPDPQADCGRGIHASPSLLEAVGFQAGPSIYAEVEPIDIIAVSRGKVRARGASVVHWLTETETDTLAGFRLWEANHPADPRLIAEPIALDEALRLLAQWASVWALVGASVGASVRDSVWALVGASVRDSVWALVGASVWDSVGDSVGASVRDSVWGSVGALVGASVWDSVGDSVGASVRDSVGAYTGSLFPVITSWRYAEALGPAPWEPLRQLWLGGYVPSFDGALWRLHSGPELAVAAEWRP